MNNIAESSKFSINNKEMSEYTDMHSHIKSNLIKSSKNELGSHPSTEALKRKRLDVEEPMQIDSQQNFNNEGNEMDNCNDSIN